MPRKRVTTKRKTFKRSKDRQQDRRILRIERNFSPEPKYYPANTGLVSVAANGDLYSVYPVQGVTSTTRIGTRVKWIGVDFIITLYNTSVSNEIIRGVMFYDYAVNNATFTNGELFGQTSNYFESGFNIDTCKSNRFCPFERKAGIKSKNRKRFEVLWDKYHFFPGANAVAGTAPNNNSNAQLTWRRRIPLNAETNYSGTAGTIADVIDTQPHLLLIAATGAVINARVSALWYYTDA